MRSAVRQGHFCQGEAGGLPRMPLARQSSGVMIVRTCYVSAGRDRYFTPPKVGLGKNGAPAAGIPLTAIDFRRLPSVLHRRRAAAPD
jgi:hypothetical protein